MDIYSTFAFESGARDNLSPRHSLRRHAVCAKTTADILLDILSNRDASPVSHTSLVLRIVETVQSRRLEFPINPASIFTYLFPSAAFAPPALAHQSSAACPLDLK